jgi:hypothetical protein
MSLPPSAPDHPHLSIDLNAHVQYTCGRHIVTLFKECLDIMTQLAEEHDEAMGKLYEALPEQYRPYVALADHFTEEKEGRIRKAILARGNDCRRAVDAELGKYQMTLGGSGAYDRDDTSTSQHP